MWVALAGQCRRSYLSAVTPIADKRDCGRIVRFWVKSWRGLIVGGRVQRNKQRKIGANGGRRPRQLRSQLFCKRVD